MGKEISLWLKVIQKTDHIYDATCTSTSLITLNNRLLNTHCVIWVSCLQPELSQHPDAIGEFHGLIQHVLSIHCALGYGEDVATLKFVGGCICTKNITQP